MTPADADVRGGGAPAGPAAAGRHALVGLRKAVARRPQHAALAALVAGLVAGGLRGGAGAMAAVAAVAAWSAPRPALAALLTGAAAVGGVVATLRLHALDHSALAAHAGASVDADATVLEPPRAGPYGVSAFARLHGERVLLRLRGTGALDVGAIVAIRGVLRRAGPYARSRGAHVEVAVSALRDTGRARRSIVDPVRRVARRALSHGTPGAVSGLHRGMVLGDDSALPDDVRNDFRSAGLSHLVAASGANVALVAALAVAVGTALGLGIVGRWLLVLGLIVLYVPLAGSGPSILRAGVMGGIGAAAMLAGRAPSRWHALLVAAAATLALDPRAVADPGWQMSFAAVIALLLAGRRWAQRLRGAGLPAPLADATAVTCAATLATAPIVAAHFDRVSLVSLPVNVIAAPLVAPIMWLGALAIAAEPLVPALAGALDAVAAYPLACLVALAHVAAGLPPAQQTAGPLPVGAAAAGAAAIAERRAVRRVWAARGGSRSAAVAPRRGVFAVAAGAVALAVASGVFAAGAAGGRRRAPAPGGLRVTFLDVGQGDAVLAQMGAHAILVDAGPPDGGVVARLRRAGVRRLDLLVITHAETDHAGGAAAVLRALPVGAVLDGRDGVDRPAARAAAVVAAGERVRRIVPDAGMVVRAGAMAFHVLWPHAEPGARHAGANPNDRAVVAELDAGGARVLLPADAESPITLPLHVSGPIGVLKVAHHASADDGLPALLRTLRPAVAVVSVGAHNPFGHPTAQALRALAPVPLVLRTDRDGSVRLDWTGAGWAVRRHV